jgi:hypothetical protein
MAVALRGRDAEICLTYAQMIDRTSVRVPQHAANCPQLAAQNTRFCGETGLNFALSIKLTRTIMARLAEFERIAQPASRSLRTTSAVGQPPTRASAVPRRDANSV